MQRHTTIYQTDIFGYQMLFCSAFLCAFFVLLCVFQKLMCALFVNFLITQLKKTLFENQNRVEMQALAVCGYGYDLFRQLPAI